MGLLSSSVSVCRYKVDGRLEDPVIERVAKGLRAHCIGEIDEDAAEKSIGWTSFETPFQPKFDGSSFVYGEYFIFSLRIDRKSIPPKLIKKHFEIESAKKLSASGREFLSKNEKQLLKDHVINQLSLRIPATPNVYDLIWDYEKSTLCLLSNLKAANEALESLFMESFELNLIRLFPYTAVEISDKISDSQRDLLTKASSSQFID